MKYAGIGSRETPISVLLKMENVAEILARKGHILRSGGARGADSAFEQAHRRIAGDERIEIFRSAHATPEALRLASLYHPNWEAVKKKGPYVMGLMGRNMQILLGRDLNDPVDLVICWTPNGRITGGTGQALRLAEAKQIPVINIGKGKDYANDEWKRIVVGRWV